MSLQPRIFLVGPPRVGKTTVVDGVIKQVKDAGLRPGGILTVEVREDGRRVGFTTREIDGPAALIAHKDWAGEPRVGRYRVNVPAFEQIALPALDRAAAHADVIVVDEIGRMELFSDAFVARLEELLTWPRPLVATAQLAPHPILDQWKAGDEIELVTVSEGNRNSLAASVASRLIDDRGAGPAAGRR